MTSMRTGEGDALVFGERFARNSAAGMAGLGLFAAVTVVVDGRLFPFVAVVLCLLLSHWMRRRAMHDERRRNEAMEDERDRVIASRGDRGFRIAASVWMVGSAIALAVPQAREFALAEPLRMPGLLLLGVIVANVAGHAVVAALYRRERR